MTKDVDMVDTAKPTEKEDPKAEAPKVEKLNPTQQLAAGQCQLIASNFVSQLRCHGCLY